MPLATRIVTHASQDRLETLIRERLRRGSDRKAIDQRIWDLFGEDTGQAGEILITGSVHDHLPAGARARKIPRVPPGTRAAYRLSY